MWTSPNEEGAVVTGALKWNEVSIHPTAVIEKGAELGLNVSVGPFTCIEGGVTVGDDCVIGPHVSILRYTTLGKACAVHAGAVLGDLPQDLSFKSDESYLRIGANCRIREGVTLHRGTKPGTATELGDNCYLMAMAHCAHNVKLANNVILANGALLGGYVEVGERAFISGHCLIHQFVRVGRLAFLSGGCGVSKDVPPFCTVHGLTVNRVAALNMVGLRRASMGPDERLQIQQAFALLYRSGLNTSQAVAHIKESFSGGPAFEIAAFVESSHRGICGFESAPEEG